jgi:long-chain fatty acid transport protein
MRHHVRQVLEAVIALAIKWTGKMAELDHPALHSRRRDRKAALIACARPILQAGLSAALMAAGLSGAQAGSFAIRDQSASAQGEAFAGVAAGTGGLSSMFWNPATMTALPGWRSSAIVSLIVPYANLTPQTGTFPFLLPLGPAGNMSRPAPLPALYNSYQVNDRLWLGVSLNAPDGLASNPRVPSASQLYGLKSELKSGEGMFSLAYKINDMLSVAAGLRVLYLHLYEETAIAATAAPPLSKLKGDGWDVGYILGATLKPFPGTEIGIGYRSRIVPIIDGTLSFDVPLFFGLIPAGVYDVNLKFPVPESVNIGVRQRIGDRFTAAATYEWTHWNILTSFPVVGSPVPGQTAPFFYRNGWMVSFGGEYKWNPRLTLRAGIGYERSPITDAIREVRNPDTDRRWGAVGLSYAATDRLSLDLSYAHYLPGNVSIAIVPGNPHFAAVGLPFVGNVAGRLDIVSLGLNYRWDEASPVRKD